MLENLRLLYLAYGGVGATLRSLYFWISACLSAFSYTLIIQTGWESLNISIMPSMIGFTVAAFALMFAILDQKSLGVLLPKDKDGKSPIITIASNITHAVTVQTFSLIIALCRSLISKDELLNRFKMCNIDIKYYCELLSSIFSFIGIFATFYGIILVVATILSIFRVLSILVDVRS
ncbi:hypothetical protein [Xanthobacter versatilis]|uniref:hypothetical protein n=1 Tax=Xanthobacter autotrophicus (strain ATCC BAA-1158 / Py2) TaxID=78245 RepID=UPI003728E4E9